MDKLTAKFQGSFGSSHNVTRFFCPGRVNLIGEHIDHLGGCVLPAAISLGITALCRPNDTVRINVFSAAFNETISLNLYSLPSEKQNHWSDLILGVILHLRKKGLSISGCDILLESTLPKASGLSSSAALAVLSYYFLFRFAKQKEPDRIKMALDCQRIENNFIGVNCGIMDQFAVANGREDHAIFLNCETLEHEYVPLNFGDHSLLIINTNKPRILAESAYDQRRKECAEALKMITKQKPITRLVEATTDDLALLSDPIHIKRTRHAITEQQRVLKAKKALAENNLEKFGQLMNVSHASLRDDFEVSCTELDFIVAELQAEESCLGARMTGAGFGGCCVAVVHSSNLNPIKERLVLNYTERFGYSPTVHQPKISSSVQMVS